MPETEAKRENKISEEAEREYIAASGQVCPFCGAHEISGGNIDIDGGTAWQEVSCDVCRREWQDSYTLTGCTTEYN